MQKAREVMLQVLSVLVEQTRYPSDSVVSSWPKDTLDRFRTHRRECSDTSIYCYYTLNEKALIHVVNGISSEIQLLLSDPSRGCQQLETYLFHFRAFSESVSSDESQYIPAIFQASSFQTFLQISQSDRDGSSIFHSTLASTIGNYADWLSQNPTEALPVCIHFLVSEIEIAENPRIAASALVEICAVCHAALAPHCDQILNLCVGTLQSCRPDIKNQIFQSMAYLVKGLPVDEASPRLLYLLNGIMDELYQDLMKYQEVQFVL
jgi:hypothetical protein